MSLCIQTAGPSAWLPGQQPRGSRSSATERPSPAAGPLRAEPLSALRQVHSDSSDSRASAVRLTHWMAGFQNHNQK